MPSGLGENLGSGRRWSRLAAGDSGSNAGLNIIPLIDIIFLLIIFFLVVCRFIEAENFPVAVPDACEYAQSVSEGKPRTTTISVMKTAEQETVFAVDSEIVASPDDGTTLVEQLIKVINGRMADLDSARKVVTLRIDRNVCFSQAQYALAAVAASNATDVQMAAFKGSQVD
jgi:biopolymer transport protein ExbD